MSAICSNCGSDMTHYDKEGISFCLNCECARLHERIEELEEVLRADSADPAERALGALEMLAREGDDPIWHSLQVNYCPVTGAYTYFRPTDNPMYVVDITRAEALRCCGRRRANEY